MQPCRTASRRLTAVQVGVARPRFINPPFPPPLVPRSPRWFSRLALLTSLFPPPPPPPIPLALCPPPWGIYVMLANNKLLLGPSGGGCGSVVMWGGGMRPATCLTTTTPWVGSLSLAHCWPPERLTWATCSVRAAPWSPQSTGHLRTAVATVRLCYSPPPGVAGHPLAFNRCIDRAAASGIERARAVWT